MSPSVLLHVVVSGLATGSIYALVALSLVIIYNATHTVNFAQGDMLMVSAFVAWSANQGLGLPLPVALGCAVGAGALLGLLVERAIIRRAISATHWDVLIITLGLSLVLRSGAGIVWTNDELPFPALFSNRPVSLGPVRVAPVSLGIIGASLALMLALVAFFHATRLGRAMRAVAQSQTAARLMGVSVSRIFSLTWAISAGIGGVAGVLIAPIIYLDPNLGFIGVKAFAGAILGGFGSIPGAIVGGMLLGVIENLSGYFFNAGIKQVSTYILLILVLVVRPAGLFGAAPVRRV